MWQHEVVVVEIVALVGVDEHKVPLASERRHYLFGIAYVQVYLTGLRRFVKSLAYEILELVVYFHRVQFGASRHPFGEA